MFYLRKEEHEKIFTLGDKEETYIAEDRAIYKHQNFSRFYRDSFPVNTHKKLKLYKAKKISTILKLRQEMFEYCGEYFDVYDENGKVDIAEYTAK